MMSKKGFTLIEVLVVVLIIGILAAIAMPQYKKAIEKSKLAEALINFSTLKKSAEMYLLANGFPNQNINFVDFSSVVALSNGEWLNDDTYATKNYRYSVFISPVSYGVEIYTTSDSNYYILVYSKDRDENECWDGNTDMGKYICHHLESQGWQYRDGDY